MRRPFPPPGCRLLATVLLPAAAVLAEPREAPELLARLRQTVPVEYRYEETRTLELMAAPWKGKGYLYSAPDGTLIKLQISPDRAIMAIAGERMIYYDDATDQRQSAPLAYAGPMAEQIRSFRAILQGRAPDLGAVYDIRAEVSGKAWKLKLSRKAPGEGAPIANIEMSGADEMRRQHILIEQADGENTRYTLEKSREGEVLAAPMRGLLAEAMGD